MFRLLCDVHDTSRRWRWVWLIVCAHLDFWTIMPFVMLRCLAVCANRRRRRRRQHHGRSGKHNTKFMSRIAEDFFFFLLRFLLAKEFSSVSTYQNIHRKRTMVNELAQHWFFIGLLFASGRAPAIPNSRSVTMFTRRASRRERERERGRNRRCDIPVCLCICVCADNRFDGAMSPSFFLSCSSAALSTSIPS